MMDEADDLLQRALIDADDSAAVALRVEGLAVSDAVTIIFHGRRDLGTIQTYVTPGGRVAGAAVGADELLRIPCDLDLADASSLKEAEGLYAEQAQALRDAIIAADTMLAVWAEPLAEAAGAPVAVQRRVALGMRLPASRLLPVALSAPERRLVVTAVCGARTLAKGRPPLGIACAQEGVARVYPLPDDPRSCLEDFLTHAAAHARSTSDQLKKQEASVARFLEINGDDLQAG